MMLCNGMIDIIIVSKFPTISGIFIMLLYCYIRYVHNPTVLIHQVCS